MSALYAALTDLAAARDERNKAMSDTRYPYTYACDYLREKAGDDYGRGLISRAAASQIRFFIAEALGLDDEYVAKALADRFLKEQE